MILTPAQLFELTGYRQNGKQISWLQKNGIRHYIRADGKPAVLPGDLAAVQDRSTVSRPNWDGLRA